jgi:fructose-specific phosphotransferase system IIC component
MGGKMTIPLVKGFKSSTIWKAFALNSIVAAVVITMAVVIKTSFDHIEIDGKKIKSKTDWGSVALSFVVTVFACYITYTIMYITFGYGGGMLSNPEATRSAAQKLLDPN